MSRKLFFIVFSFIHSVSAQPVSQLLSEPMHAKATVIAAFNNPATLPQLKGLVLTAGSARTFLLPELDHHFVSGSVTPDSIGSFAVTYTQKGNIDFRQENFSFGYARTFGAELSIYAGGIYSSIREGENYGKKQIPGCAISIQGKLGKSVFLNSLLEFPLKKDEWFFPSTIFQSGISIRCSEVCLMEASGLMTGENFQLNSGLHYTPDEKINLRSGIQTRPFSVYMGCGLRWSVFGFDISASHHPVTGFSPSVMITWFAGGNK